MSRPFDASRYARLLEGLDGSEIRLQELERTKRLDAEFFSKRHLRTSKLLAQNDTESIASIAHISDGNHFSISEHFAEDGIPYYRGQDVVGQPFIELSASNFISEAAFRAIHMHRSHLKQGDVLLSIVGSIGGAGLVTSTKPATCSCKLAILRPKTISPGFLSSFLRSEFGRSQTERFTRGAVQMGLLLEDMDQLLVARFSDRLEGEIEATVKAAHLKNLVVQKNLLAAESMLIAALGLADWQPPELLTYTRRAAEAFIASRFDAEFFHPAKQSYLDRLSALPGEPLGDHYSSVREMFDPSKAVVDEQVRNFDLTDALQPVLDDQREPMSAREVGSTKKRFKIGDVVTSRLRAYLRETALVRTSSDILSVGSSEFIVLRPRQVEPPRLGRACLLAFLRSRPVQTILHWSQDGSHHPRYSEEDLLNIPIPDTVCAASPKIELRFESVLAARGEARDLLTAAQRAVEIAIEDSEAAALAYLAERTDNLKATKY